MTSVKVFDPAMCCSTGVCGPTVDPDLVRFAADLDWLCGRGSVGRAVQPRPAARRLRRACRGHSGAPRAWRRALPLILVDGRKVIEGAYPSRDQLAGWAATGSAEKPPYTTSAPVVSRPAELRVRRGRLLLMDAGALLDPATRVLFFTGKGGMGKTTLACATAVGLAARGRRVLLVVHRPRLQPGRGPRDGPRRGAPPGRRRRGPRRGERRSRGGRPRVPRAPGRPLPRRAARRGVAQHGGEPLGRLHGRDRRLRCLHPPPGRRRGDARLRPRDLRHGADRAHAAAALAAGGLDRVHRPEHHRHLVPRAAGRPGAPAGALRRERRHPDRPRAHDPGAGRPPGAERPRRGGAHRRRAGRGGHAPSGARR